MAPGSRAPTFGQFGVERRCYGCGRPFVKHPDHEDVYQTEGALWFVGYPVGAVYGKCCWGTAAGAGRPTRPVVEADAA